jgi:hypothetical protein
MKLKINDKVELLKNDNNNGTKTPKNSKGIIVHIPSWRNDAVGVEIEGLGYRFLSISVLKQI